MQKRSRKINRKRKKKDRDEERCAKVHKPKWITKMQDSRVHELVQR